MDPQSTSLLLLDLQEAVLQTVPDSARLIAEASRTLQWARQRRLAVRYVRLSLNRADRVAVPVRNPMFSRLAASGFCASESDGIRIPASIAPDLGERIYEKTRMGTARTTLWSDLAADGVETLILGGAHTSGVVLSTLREAADLDYRLIVPAELCTDPDPEMHNLMLERLFPRQAEVIALNSLFERAP